MAELLIEIFSEEIPARMQERAGQDLLKAMDAGLKEAGLSPTGSKAMTGPRRLVYVTDVALRSPDVSEERKGPRVGSPEQALAGFMRGAGLSDISEAETRSDKKGEFYVAVINRPGRDTADVLAELLPTVMGKFPWPKSMKSGDSDFRWVRPLRGLTVLLDGKSLDGIEIGGIVSDNVVHGHRQMGPGPFTVTSLADYREQLEGPGHVMLDREARKARVLEQAKAVCEASGLSLVEDIGLLGEVTGLVEWPVALLGDMDPDFLELPEDVIRLTLKTHQKTFTVRGPDGKLAPHFVIMANLETADDGATIKAGNAKVISARLSDARFFQQEDAKKPLADYYDQLDTVVFHKKLGSLKDKAERVAALARSVARHVGADPDKAEQAAKLAKCDLVTQTVIEMTSLQGQIGRLMYEREGGDPAIARAIEDHYKPKGASDTVPTEPVSIAVALADKLDTLVGFWAIDEKPTGSKDPFGLRRAALGLVRILLDNQVNLSTSQLIFTSAYVLEALWSTKVGMTAVLGAIEGLKAGSELTTIDHLLADGPDLMNLPNIAFFKGIYIEREIVDGVLLPADYIPSFVWYEPAASLIDLGGFLQDRLRVYLRDQGQRHDVIDAALADSGDDLLAIAKRVEALGALLGTDDGENLVQGYKRAANILRAERKKGELPESAEGDYTAPEAEALAAALSTTTPAIDTALASNDYPAALDALASLRAPIDAFFDGVMVNSDDAAERARRLGLLMQIEALFSRIADFSKLDG